MVALASIAERTTFASIYLLSKYSNSEQIIKHCQKKVKHLYFC